MLKNKVTLEVKKGENEYALHLGPNSPLGEIYDVLIEMKDFVVSKLNEHAEASKKLEDSQEKPSDQEAQ